MNERVSIKKNISSSPPFFVSYIITQESNLDSRPFRTKHQSELEFQLDF